MADEQSVPDVKAFLDKIEVIQRQLSDTNGYHSKLKSRLERTKKALKTKPSIAAQISLLVRDLEAAKDAPETPTASQIIDGFHAQLRSFIRKLQDGFPSSLRQVCETARLDFKAMPEGFRVGPFVAIADFPKESAILQYAKVTVAKDVPLNEQSIVTLAKSLKADLIDAAVDLPRFGKDIHEAIRVAVARRESRPSVSELRVELPAAFREISFIRSPAGSSSAKRAAGEEYTMAQFIIELKQFIQSDSNLKSPQQCRLEPAVIENTKNPKKSIFVPRDIACGFGEGTYYQAIVMQQK